jgi:acyl-CoA synthetase (NDP forming)|uniref:ATP-grasp domain-containing protein n=1 Tax=Desulfobacca acetoxidans TaxID=60893 RepID=A0A7V6A142_9BACT
MQKFYYPQKVAVVGVSENPSNLGRGIILNMLEAGYTGTIYPVGPRGGSVYGLPIYTHLKELPEQVDLAAVLTPARFVPQVVADCGEMGITRVVVESGGFSELGEQGRALEEEIVRLIETYHIRLIGPNGLGLINMEIGLSLPFSQIVPVPRRGNISVISQSGGVGMHVISWMTKEGLGLNKFLSLGNKLNVKENEALTYFLEDPGTEFIYIYLEGLEDGRGLLEVARHATKPIFLQMPNVVSETTAIAMSHTASLATDEKVVDAACRQGNIFRVLRQSDFLNAAKMVGQAPVKGNRLVILSRSGGEAVVAAYACKRYGFRLPPLSKGLADFILESSRSQIIKPGNPIDLGDIFDFQVYSKVMEHLCQDPEVDAVLLNYGPVYDPEREDARAMAKHLIKRSREAGKPLAISVCATLEEEDFFREEMGVPAFHFPGDAVRALSYSRSFALRQPPDDATVDAPRFDDKEITALLSQAGGSGFLPMPQAFSLMSAAGLSVAGWRIATNADMALKAASQLGFPVVLKLSAPSLVHKTEAGGVLLNLVDLPQVAAAYQQLADLAARELPAGEAWEAVVMRQVVGGDEVLLGGSRDQSFGALVACGAGGILTEILEDVSLRVAPVSPKEARRQILETRIGRILEGVRGRPAGDLEALSRALSVLSHLMERFPQVQEVDLNPVRVFPTGKGILVLDARVRVGEG